MFIDIQITLLVFGVERCSNHHFVGNFVSYLFSIIPLPKRDILHPGRDGGTEGACAGLSLPKWDSCMARLRNPFSIPCGIENDEVDNEDDKEDENEDNDSTDLFIIFI